MADVCWFPRDSFIRPHTNVFGERPGLTAKDIVARLELGNVVPHGFHLPSDAAINGGEKLGQGTITVAITPACNTASQQTNPATITEKNRTTAHKSSGVFSVWHVNIQQVVSFDLVWKGSVSNGFTGTAKIPHTAVTCPPFTFKATINKKSSSTHHKILVNPSSAGNYTFKAHFVSRPSKIKRTVSKTFKITAS